MLTWNAAEVTAAMAVVRPARPAVLAAYRDMVEARLGTAWPRRDLAYYDLVAGDWIDRLMDLAWAGWRAHQQDEPAGPLGPAPVTWTSLVFDQRATVDEHLVPWVRAAAEQLAAPDGSPVLFEPIPARPALEPRAPQWKHAVGRASAPDAPVLLCRPYYRGSKRTWAAALWRLRHLVRWDDLGYDTKAGGLLDTGWRVDRALASTPVRSYVDLAIALLPLLVPIALLEGHAATRDAVLALPVARPRVCYTANGLIGCLPLKFLAAAWRDEGTRVFAHQHGGGYGVDLVHEHEAYETSVADTFFTWGWTDDRPSLRVLSPPVPGDLRREPQKVLLCCVDFPKVYFRLHYHPMPGTIETMHRETVTCAQAMAAGAVGATDQLAIRPYPWDYGWGFDAALRAAAPLAAIDRGPGVAARLYRNTRLVVHNYLGTSWLETLALDVPTVIFYDPATYAFRPQAQPVMDALAAAGILHQSGASAAKVVNDLVRTNGIYAWWKSAPVRAARDAAVSRFARFGADWVDQWQREFESV